MSIDVSIVIATYNVERYIESAVTSALNQEGVAVEVIIVDDCSTDNTWGMIVTMTDPRIKGVRLLQNSGPGAARSKGFQMATGTWIAVLDSDDQFLPGRLQHCITKAREQNADIIADNIRVVSEEDGNEFAMFPQAFLELKQLDLATFIKQKLPGATNNYTLGYLKPVFSTAFLRHHNLTYDPSLRIGEDYMLVAEALALGANCIVEPKPGYLYTARAGSISYRLSLANIGHMIEADARFTARYKLSPEAAEAQRKRELSLKKEYAYTKLIDAIKQKNILGFLGTMLSSPSALLLLYRPVEARIQRLIKRTHAGTTK